MKDIGASIKSAREWIIIYGLIFFGSIGFIYSNVAIFALLSSEGFLGVPRLLLIIYQAWTSWIALILITFIAQIICMIYSWMKERRR